MEKLSILEMEEVKGGDWTCVAFCWLEAVLLGLDPTFCALACADPVRPNQ